MNNANALSAATLRLNNPSDSTTLVAPSGPVTIGDLKVDANASSLTIAAGGNVTFNGVSGA